MRKTRKIKMLSILLALAMLIGTMPQTAFIARALSSEETAAEIVTQEEPAEKEEPAEAADTADSTENTVKEELAEAADTADYTEDTVKEEPAEAADTAGAPEGKTAETANSSDATKEETDEAAEAEEAAASAPAKSAPKKNAPLNAPPSAPPLGDPATAADPAEGVYLKWTKEIETGSGEEYVFFDDVAFYESDDAFSYAIDQPRNAQYQYRIVLSNVTCPAGGISYTWDGNIIVKDDDDIFAVPMRAADIGKTYEFTYRAQYLDTEDNNTWKDVNSDNAKCIHTVKVVDKAPDNVSIGGMDEIIMRGGSNEGRFDFFGTDHVEATIPNHMNSYMYRIVLTGVEKPSGGQFTWPAGKELACQNMAGFKAYYWTDDPNTILDESDLPFIPYKEADKGKEYKVSYKLQYAKDWGDDVDPENWVWADLAGDATHPTTHETTVKILDDNRRNYVTDDDARVNSIALTIKRDGTPNADENGNTSWDADDSAGNDSGPSNGKVRTFDSVEYNAKFTTQVKTTGVEYKHGYLWCEVVLPCTKDVAELQKPGVAQEFKSEATMVTLPSGETVAGTKYTFYYELHDKTDSNGHYQPALPQEGNFGLTMNVYNAKNGDKIKPTMRMAVAQVEVDANGNLVKNANGNPKVVRDYTAEEEDPADPERYFDVPAAAEGPDVEISAAPAYNVTIHHIYSGRAGIWDFDQEGQASNATDSNAGKVYGRLFRLTADIRMQNGDLSRGMKGLELPDSNTPITFKLNFDTKFKTEAGETHSAASPLLLEIENSSTSSSGSFTEMGRTVGKTNISGGPYRVFDGRRFGNYNFTTNVNYTNYLRNSTWNGGKWSGARSASNGNSIDITVSDFIVNPLWFPKTNNNANNAYVNPDGSYKVGVFTSRVIYLVVPFSDPDGSGKYMEELPDEDDPEYSSRYYGGRYGNGEIQFTLRDSDLSVTSVSGQDSLTVFSGSSGQSDYRISADPSTSNNEDQLYGRALLLKGDGDFSRGIIYSPASCSNVDVFGTQSIAFSNAKDARMYGTKVGIKTDASQRINEAMTKWNRAGLQLVKFDPDFLTPESDASKPADAMWATKPDGSGWTSDDEMKQAGEADLCYWNSLSDVPAGHLIVGALREYDFGEPTTNTYNTYQCYLTDMQIKAQDPNTDLREKVYGKTTMTCMAIKFWKVAAYEEIAQAAGGTFPTHKNGGLSNGETALDKYNVAPSYDDTMHNSTQSYVKAYYDEDGFHNSEGVSLREPRWADTLYVVPYSAELSKVIEQKNGPDGGNVTFNLGNGENIVDYRINTGFKMPDTTAVNPDWGGMTTTLTIKDTLPANSDITFYGSAYLGGTYVGNGDNNRLHGSVTGGAQIPNNGEMSDPFTVEFNGREYQVTADMQLEYDGTNGCLKPTFHIYNMPIGGEVPAIRFSAQLPEDANGQYVNVASVQTTEDRRNPLKQSLNMDDAVLEAVRSGNLVVRKTADQPFFDAGEDLAWTLQWTNTDDTNAPKNVMMDVLPANNDGNGSHFNGTLSIKTVKVDFPSGKGSSDYKFYYTTDAAATSSAAFDLGLPYDDFTGANPTVEDISWIAADIQADGSVNLPPPLGGNPVTAMVILGDLGAREHVKMHVTLEPQGNKPGDVIVNCARLNKIKTTSTVQIIERVLKGTVWQENWDEIDGVMNKDRERLHSGVNVRLMRKNASGVWVEFGTTVTDFYGNYEFTHLPSGEFKVQFMRYATDEGYLGLNGFGVTEKNVDYVSMAQRSQAEGVDDSEVFAEINDISFAPASQVTMSPVVSRYHNLGIWRPVIAVKKTVDSTGAENETAERNRYFEFKLTVPNCPQGYYQKRINNQAASTSPETVLKNGAKVGLRDRDVLTFEIPLGVPYTVEEYDYEGNHFGYTTTVNGQPGLKITGTPTESILDTDSGIARIEVEYVNKYEPETMAIPVEKKWDDKAGKGQSGYSRPDSVSVQLYKDGEAYGDAVVLSGANNWKHEFRDLPVYKPRTDAEWNKVSMYDDAVPVPEAQKFTYTIEETKIADDSFIEVNGEKRCYLFDDTISVNNAGETFAVLGYFTNKVVENADGSFSVTNTYVPAKDNEFGDTGLFVKKVDKNGEAITSGPATFKLTAEAENMSLALTAKTNDKGIAKFAPLAEGVYTLTETKAPKGYIKSEYEYRITVTKTGRTLVEVSVDENSNTYDKIFTVASDGEWDEETLTLTVANEKKTRKDEVVIEKAEGSAEFYVKKVDQDGDVITESPAMFELASLDGSDVVAAETSRDSGIAVFTELKAGTYTLKETIAPKGYVKDDKAYTVKIEEADKELKDSKTETSTRTEEDGTEVTTTTITKLYEQHFKVSSDGDWDEETLILSVANEKKIRKEETVKEEATGSAGFYVKKVDQDGNVITGNPALFELAAEGSDDAVTAKTSEDSGIAEFKELKAGTYTLTEKEAPEGYAKDDKTYTIKIEEAYKILKETDVEISSRTEDDGTEVEVRTVNRFYEQKFEITSDGEWDSDSFTLTIANKKLNGRFSITKKVDKTVAVVGDILNYTITITNVGDGTLYNQTVWDVLPDQLTYQSDDSDGIYGVEDGRERIDWKIDELAPGESMTVILSTRLKECHSGDKIINVAYTMDEGEFEFDEDDADTTVMEAYEPEIIDSPDEPHEVIDKVPDKPKTDDVKPTKIHGVKTGDSTPTGMLLIIFGISISALLLMRRHIKKRS